LTKCHLIAIAAYQLAKTPGGSFGQLIK
jgi:hypothetical protein